MERKRSGAPVEVGLTVVLDGVVARQLESGEVLTFGRWPSSTTHLHVGPPDGRGDGTISRRAGSVRCSSGQWVLRNESEKRAFVVVVHDAVRVPMAAKTAARFSQWAIGPDGVAVELPTAMGTYTIEFRPVRSFDTSVPLSLPGTGWSTVPPPAVSAHERVVLAAKFLSRRQPGAAVGDACAAERATRALGTGRVVTAKAVENVVKGWRTFLEEQHLPDVAGRGNVDRVGAYLLAFRVLSEDDRLDLPPVEDDDPRV